VSLMKIIIQAFKLFLLMTLITGVVYPVLITLLGQVIFPNTANGSLIITNGKIIGSELLSQKFSQDRYFQPRPSATDFNPLPSGGSNLGPTSAALRDSVIARKIALAQANPGNGEIPADLLYASASGLDPDISPEAARYQIERVARIRGLDNIDKTKLINIVEKQIKQPDLGVFGEPRVNVLRLNLIIDSTFTGQNHER
jgi:potassium-transporting ATPase KdpC subunit